MGRLGDWGQNVQNGDVSVLNYKDQFKNFGPEIIQATENLISAKPWLWNPNALVQWLKDVGAIYRLQCPALIIDPGFGTVGCYIQELNLIILPKCSIFTLLHEFRHAWQHQTQQFISDEEDARGWSCSLVYQTKPKFFENAVRKGLVFFC